MNYNRYNTTIYHDPKRGEIQLLNDLATVIARVEVVEKRLIWAHDVISDTDASALVREHHEAELAGNGSRLARHYENLNYQTIFHAMTAAIRNGSTLYPKLGDRYKAVKRMDGYMEHMKVCAVNPGRFSVGTCLYCKSGCYVEDVALISIGIPLVENEEANIHGAQGISISPICDRCSAGVSVEN